MTCLACSRTQTQISVSLSGLDAADHTDRQEILHMRRPFILLGSCLFSKVYTLTACVITVVMSLRLKTLGAFKLVHCIGYVAVPLVLYIIQY